MNTNPTDPIFPKTANPQALSARGDDLQARPESLPVADAQHAVDQFEQLSPAAASERQKRQNSTIFAQFKKLPDLETERVHLRRLRTEDKDDIFAFTQDKKVAEYCEWNPHTSVQQTEKWIKSQQENAKESKPNPWGLTLRGSDKVVGTCSFEEGYEEEGGWLAKGHADLGFVLSREHQGQGLMTEVLQEVIRFGQEHNLHHFRGVCEVNNARAIKMMQRDELGFTLSTKKFKPVRKEGDPQSMPDRELCAYERDDANRTSTKA